MVCFLCKNILEKQVYQSTLQSIYSVLIGRFWGIRLRMNFVHASLMTIRPNLSLKNFKHNFNTYNGNDQSGHCISYIQCSDWTILDQEYKANTHKFYYW